MNKPPPPKTAKVGLFGILGSGNSGNDASMETVLDYLAAAHPDAIVDVMGGGTPEQMRTRYGIAITPLYWYSKHEGRMPGPVAAPVKALGKGLDVFRTMSWVRRHDVVIMPGTGPLELTLPVRPWGYPFTLLVVAVSGRIFRTKVALVSVGAGPVRQRTSRWLSNATARLACYRSYRDEHSLAAMRARGIDTSRDRVYPDLVFGVPTPPYEPGDLRAVGVGVMAYHGGNDDRAQAAEIHSSYVEKMTQFTSWLVNSGHRVRLFGGDSKFDWDVADQVLAAVRRERPDLGPAVVSAERADSYADLMRLMSPMGTVVATRYHNVMCALKLCKPTISLGYSRKFADLMTDMGLAEFSLSANSFSVAQLIEQFEAVKTRHAELRQQMAEANAANMRALDDQFTVLSQVLFDEDSGDEGDGGGKAVPASPRGRHAAESAVRR